MLRPGKGTIHGRLILDGFLDPYIRPVKLNRSRESELSQRKRKRVEQSFGWMKMVGRLRKVKLRGIDKVGWLFTFTGAAYNLCRLRNLMAST